MARRERAIPLGSAAHRASVRHLLERPRFEVIPLAGIVDDAAKHLPAGATVTVTASPTRGPEPTLETAAALARVGFHAVPHLAATQYCEESLPEALQQIGAAGIREVFIVGGDSAPPRAGAGHDAGDRQDRFGDGLQLIEAVRRLAPQLHVGVPGYPEGHPRIPQQSLEQSLARKAEHAACVVGQLCFDPHTVTDWAVGLRTRGLHMSVYAGLPGAVGSARLMRIAGRIGVGDSLRFLSSGGTRTALRLVSPGRYDPTPLVTGLVRADGGVVVSGIHLYTFNALQETQLWRRRLLARLQEGDPR